MTEMRLGKCFGACGVAAARGTREVNEGRRRKVKRKKKKREKKGEKGGEEEKGWKRKKENGQRGENAISTLLLAMAKNTGIHGEIQPY